MNLTPDMPVMQRAALIEEALCAALRGQAQIDELSGEDTWAMPFPKVSDDGLQQSYHINLSRLARELEKQL
jgi:hypothetical protein